MTDSPFRNRSVDENLTLFENMRLGKYEEGECCLWLKVNMQHPNPCMRDPVAYRIKYCSHPHVGDKWCIYPTYDYTHSLTDSIENITHSLCTLEFEIWREIYYWTPDTLGIYKAFEWEYSRLNLSGSVLSKRKIDALIKNNLVTGWNDPRLLTLDGLKRKGYTPEAINSFIDCMGVTRRGNENVVSFNVLENHLRKDLDKRCPWSFCVLDPIKIVISNVASNWSMEAEGVLYPDTPERGTNKFPLSNEFYIERTDFSEKDDKRFWGLSPS